MRNLTLPFDSFLWGASTSGFQAEGGRHEGGKSLATTDVRNTPPSIADSSVAADHYHHMEEDVRLMKELGMNVYRFSFQWSRIMRDGLTPNPEGIEFYNRLINACLDQGIIPFPTLYHFEMPQNLVDQFGGWCDRQCIDAFVRYAEVCFDAFGDRVQLWGTINEQLIVTAASDLNGNHAADPHQRMKNMYQMSYNMSVAEKKVMALAHEKMPGCRIGPVCSMQVVYPETPSPENMEAARNAQDFLQNMFLDMSVFGRYPLSVINYLKQQDLLPDMPAEDQPLLAAHQPDLIGINYYASCCIRALNEGEDNSKLPPFYRNSLFTLGSNTYLPKTEWMEFGIDPKGLYTGIRDIYERYHLPVIITENGMAYSEQLDGTRIEDDYRIDYLNRHIEQVKRLRAEGYPLMGYCIWSLFDLVSSHQGFAKRYGLIYIDRTDTDVKECRRIPKKSYYWYQSVIAQDHHSWKDIPKVQIHLNPSADETKSPSALEPQPAVVPAASPAQA